MDIKKSTLGLYGHRLPIGVFDPNRDAVGKTFAFRPIDYATEKEIDKRRSKIAGDHPGKVVAEVLATVLTEWAGCEDFATKNHAHKIGAIENSYSEDVMYAWIALRVEVMGEVFALGVECQMCGHEHTWETDLNGLSITVTEEKVEPRLLPLRRPVSFGENTFKEVLVAPVRWGAINRIKAKRRASFGDIKAEMVRDAIHAVKDGNGNTVPLAPRVYEMMRKLDRERIVKALDSDEFPRCDLRFEIDCPDCGHTSVTSLDWTWDFFFGSASLPEL